MERMNANKTKPAIQWIVIYPVDSVLELLNNPGQTDWALGNAKLQCATGFSGLINCFSTYPISTVNPIRAPTCNWVGGAKLKIIYLSNPWDTSGIVWSFSVGVNRGH